MKKYATYGAFTLIVIALLLELPAVIDALLSFLLVGAIPGTSLSVSPNFMFLSALITICVLAATFMIERFSFVEKSTRTATKTAKRYKKNLPKRRYRHISSTS